MVDFQLRFDKLVAERPLMSSFIDGDRIDGLDEIAVFDPATGLQWSRSAGRETDVADAVASAKAAFNAPGWALLGVDARAALLSRLADLIERDADELALLETLASGKPVTATVPEIRAAATWFRYYAGLAANAEGVIRPLSATAVAHIVREPLGVVAAITPFNAAFSLGIWKIAPALAMGNAVVVKPPHDAALSTIRLAQLALEAGFPAGILNIVVGDARAGAALADDPRVDGISITGSTVAARKVGMAAAARLRHFSAEAGGKSAHIVFDDADLDNAVVAATQGVFSAAGQTCVAGSRLLLHASIHDAFIEKYLERIGRLRVGNPRLPQTHVGPLAAMRHEDRVRGFVERAVGEGAVLLAGGGRPALSGDLEGGAWFAPTVLAGTAAQMEIVQEEVFGPVVAVQRFETEEEAVHIANGVDYGLAAGFWTGNPGRIARVSRQLQAGTVWVNTYRTIHWRVPFGGYKQSGVGRENGPEALNEFSQIKSVIADHGPARDPFAY